MASPCSAKRARRGSSDRKILAKTMGKDVDYTKTPSEDFASVMIEFETDDGFTVLGEASTSWIFRSEDPGEDDGQGRRLHENAVRGLRERDDRVRDRRWLHRARRSEHVVELQIGRSWRRRWARTSTTRKRRPRTSRA